MLNKNILNNENKEIVLNENILNNENKKIGNIEIINILFELLSLPPIFNEQTTFQVIMSPKNNIYVSKVVEFYNFKE
jgi:hypothetical protein